MLSWEEYIKEKLLSKGLVSGVSLIDQHATCIYTHGNLTEKKNTWHQLVNAFNLMSMKQEDNIINKGFTLHLTNQGQVHFKIFHKTYCSIYAVSTGGQMGLIVCNLPQGILTVTHQQPTNATHVIQAVETFCQPLRA